MEGFYSFYNESSPNPDLWSACDDGAARSCWSEKCGAQGSLSNTVCTGGDAVYQHGPGEGLADVVEACAMDAVGSENFLLWWPFIYCFEGVELSAAYPAYAYGVPKSQAMFREAMFNGTQAVNGSSFRAAINYTMAAAQQCAVTTGMNWTYIQACADPSVGSDGQLQLGARGEALEAENALATVKLEPPHWYTPWIVFQGSPVWLNDDDLWGGSFAKNSELLNWICAAYTGDLPEGCPSSPSPIPENFLTGPPPTPIPTETPTS